ncbi:hypothetical protein BHF68_00165 [Desulfuribacillus alkaliarsenatis]|uniref:histidine kinase n=1 Tax=Desulfuribacillus alkaliarsenatis TaxID=766136 RepID=A0A1E5G4Q3_9FIRM|nr:hypothetical protein BHF68_00165 [Desulfuribacillus alkaliarsenatis]
MNLIDWDWETDGIVSLDGQWEFYWEHLLTPEDFNNFKLTNTTLPNDNSYITVPRAWNKFELDDTTLTGEGYATYRLLIHNTDAKLLALKIPRIFTAYTLWINNEVIASAGQVGIAKQVSTPQYLPQVNTFYTDAEIIEVVIQVSNFHHRSGGILEAIYLGTEAQIRDQKNSNLALEMFLVGSLFIIGFYHLALYSYRTKDKSTLYFGIYALLISLRTMLVGEIFFIQMVPAFSWELAHKLQTLAFYLSIPLLFIFLRSIYPNDTSRNINKAIIIVGLSFALLVVLTPARIFTLFNPLYQIFTVMLIPYALYILYSINKNQRDGCYIITAGLIFLIAFTMNDILFLSILLNDADNHILRNIITRGNLSSWGLLIFVFSQSLIIAKKFSKSFTNVELMSDKLQHLNENLEAIVNDRTQALETSKQELEEAYEALSRSEKSRQHLVQNVSHDLRTPLTTIKGYIGAILDGIIADPEQQKAYLKRVNDKANSIDFMVQSLMELSQLESRQLQLNLKSFTLDTFLNDYTKKLTADMHVSKIEFHTHISSELNNNTDKFYVRVDTEQLNRVFTNLLSNAINHTPVTGKINLYFAVNEDKTNLVIQLSDTGSGIAEQDLPHIFERFYKVSKARSINAKSVGLGLAITREIIEYHGGRIWVESQESKGSSFYFTLPVHYEEKEG